MPHGVHVVMYVTLPENQKSYRKQKNLSIKPKHFHTTQKTFRESKELSETQPTSKNRNTSKSLKTLPENAKHLQKPKRPPQNRKHFHKTKHSRKRKTPPKKTKSTSRKPKSLPQNLKHFQKNRPAMRACSYWYVNMVLFSMYSYFRKDCRKAYALISLGILGA